MEKGGDARPGVRQGLRRGPCFSRVRARCALSPLRTRLSHGVLPLGPWGLLGGTRTQGAGLGGSTQHSG